MRIDSGLQGYYYDQGRFKRPDLDGDDPTQVPAQQPARVQQNFQPLVSSSTVLSSSLSSALWQLESVSEAPSSPAPAPSSPGDSDADKVNAYYLEYSGDGDSYAA